MGLFYDSLVLYLPTLCHPANSQRACAGPWGMPQLLISLYHLTRRRQGKMRRALPYPETPRRPSIPRPWRGRCSTNRPQAAFPALSALRPASISKTPAAARPRLHPALRLLPRAEWQPKGQRHGRCPLGLTLLAIPEGERKSRQRIKRCLPFDILCYLLLFTLSPLWKARPCQSAKKGSKQSA